MSSSETLVDTPQTDYTGRAQVKTGVGKRVMNDRLPPGRERTDDETSREALVDIDDQNARRHVVEGPALSQRGCRNPVLEKGESGIRRMFVWPPVRVYFCKNGLRARTNGV